MNNGGGGSVHGLGPSIVGPNSYTGMVPQGQGNLGFMNLMGQGFGKPPTKEDNGSPPADIYNPDMTNVNGAFGNGGSMQQPYPSTPPPTSGPSMGPPAQPAYSAQSYGQSFAPFPDFNSQAQAAFNPLPQTNVNQYGRFDPTQWPGMVGTWPTLFGGPGAPAAQSMGTANVNGMTAPQQALNAQFQRWYGK